MAPPTGPAPDRHPLRPLDLAVSRGGTGLRPTLPSDVAPLFEHVHGREEILRWLCWRGPADLEQLHSRYVPATFGEAGATFGVMLAVVDEASGAPIGECSLTFEGETGACELGYWLGAEAHGRGHGSRLVELALELGFERVGSHTVTASVKGGNDRSLAALRSAGFDVRPALGSRPGGGAGGIDPGRPGRADGIAWYASLTRRAWARRAEERRS
ncbi:MAG: GNAT family N-acetyltransferase [Planctomycetota bacterium]